MIDRYTFTLDDKVIKEVKEEIETGQKISPLVNNLLKKWVEDKKAEKSANLMIKKMLKEDPNAKFFNKEGKEIILKIKEEKG